MGVFFARNTVPVALVAPVAACAHSGGKGANGGHTDVASFNIQFLANFKYRDDAVLYSDHHPVRFRIQVGRTTTKLYAI